MIAAGNIACDPEGAQCFSIAGTQGTCCEGLLCEWDNVGSGTCTAK